VTATYPASIKGFTTKADFVDTVLAVTVNDLQNEVAALEANIGTYITTSSGWVGSFDQVTTTWSTLKDRLTNIEYGLNTAYNTSTSTSGGSIIQASGTGTIGLTIKAAANQTADLLELQTSDGTIVSKVDASGNIYTSGKQVVPVVYAASQPSSVPVGTIWVNSGSNIATLTAQSGIPSGGSADQVLAKNSTTDYDVTWVTTHSTPAGGASGQFLTKNSDVDYDTQWSTVSVPDPIPTAFLLGGM